MRRSGVRLAPCRRLWERVPRFFALPVARPPVSLELVTEAMVAVTVLGGLLFRDRIARRLASLETEFDRADPDDVEGR